MLDLKVIAAVMSVVFVIIAYIPYIRNTLHGKTKPHVFTWAVWFLLSLTIFGIQRADGAGLGAYAALAATFGAFIILSLGIRNGFKQIKKIDWLFLSLSFSALALWLIVDQLVLSAILISIVDVSALGPTIRKTWNHPFTETLSLFVISNFRHLFVLIAISEYTFVTVYNTTTVMIVNVLFVSLIMLRRRSV